jgi:hypothetical protein
MVTESRDFDTCQLARLDKRKIGINVDRYPVNDDRARCAHRDRLLIPANLCAPIKITAF